MGAKRKVDLKLYNKITKELKTPKDDKKVMKKYSLGQTTVRAIRNSYDYGDFVRKTTYKASKTYTSPIARRQELTTADKIIVAFTWLGVFAGIFVLFAFIRWIFSIVAGV